MDGLNKKLQVDIYSNVEVGVGLGNVLKTVLNQEDVSISTFLFFKISMFRVKYVTIFFNFANKHTLGLVTFCLTKDM